MPGLVAVVQWRFCFQGPCVVTPVCLVLCELPKLTHSSAVVTRRGKRLFQTPGVAKPLSGLRGRLSWARVSLCHCGEGDGLHCCSPCRWRSPTVCAGDTKLGLPAGALGLPLTQPSQQVPHGSLAISTRPLLAFPLLVLWRRTWVPCFCPTL